MVTLGIIFINNNNLIKYLKILFTPQILIVLLILIYSVYNFFPGSIISTEYDRVKNKYAYLYSGFQWLNENVPNNSKILIINRPISQYKDFAVSGNFNYFTNKNESIYYKKIISKYNLNLLPILGVN